MKRLSLTLLSIIITVFAIAQSPSNLRAKSIESQKSDIKGTWTVQFNHSFTKSGTIGCETDGTNYYIVSWNSNLIWKLSLTGIVLDSFTIPGVTGLRDLAFDGNYFYGGNGANNFYQMDFNLHFKLSTINSPNIGVKNICYDPVNDAFWVCNNDSDLSLVSRAGIVLNTITSATHGLTSIRGIAYDTVSAGGPYIWALSSSSTMLSQILVSTGTQTGLTHDISTDVAMNGGFGGGLWIQSNVVGNTTTIGGMIQNTSFFGYDLSTTIADLYDMDLTSISIPILSPIGQNTDIKGTFINQGVETINSYDINYQVDNGAIITQSITGANILSYQTVNFTHSTPYVATSGIHNIEVWVSNPNGNNDQNNANNNLSAQTTGYNSTSAVQRMPLYETFTSSTCGPCVGGNTNMDALFAANPNKWVCVKYQMNWPGDGDPYFTNEGEDRKFLYGVNSVPRQEIDGGYNGNSNSVTQTDIDAAYTYPSFMELTSNMILDSNRVNINYTINPKIDFPATARVYIAIVEQVTHNNTGTNSETEFHWVMKKMLPYSSGVSVGTLTAGVAVTKYASYTFNGTYRLPNNASDPINNDIEHSVEDFNNLRAVVWVQNPITKEVYQASYSSFTVGMDEQTRDDIISNIFPNPATNQININLNIPNIENVKVSLFNNIGQELMINNLGSISGLQNLSFDISGLQSGIYFVNVTIGNKKYSKPIMIN